MPDLPVVPTHDAATVVLLRDGARGLETWLLTRVREMLFAPGVSVFPGGRVEDDDAWLPCPADIAAEVAARFGSDELTARAVLGGAVRETFEETGVVLDVTGIRPWARWITPPAEPRRYDTRFFVAALPEGAEARDLTTESSVAGWVGVREALEQMQRGDRPMLPPTALTLAEVASHDSVETVLAASPDRVLVPVRPQLIRDADGWTAVLPDGSTLAMPRVVL